MKISRDYDLEIMTAMEYFNRQNYQTSTEYMKTTLEELAKPMRTFRREVENAERSGELTPNGLRNLKVREARKAWEELKARQEKVSILDRRINDLASSMRHKPKDPEEKLVVFLRQREIRDQLRGMDPLALKAVYLDAVAHDGFDEVAEAIESAPAIPGKGPLLPKRDLEEGRQMRLRRENPDVAKTIDELSAIKSVLNSFIKPSFTELEEVLGPESDPVAKTAGQGE